MKVVKPPIKTYLPVTDLTVNTESPGLYLVTSGPTDSITPTIISATGSTILILALVEHIGNRRKIGPRFALVVPAHY